MIRGDSGNSAHLVMELVEMRRDGDSGDDQGRLRKLSTP